MLSEGEDSLVYTGSSFRFFLLLSSKFRAGCDIGQLVKDSGLDTKKWLVQVPL